MTSLAWKNKFNMGFEVMDAQRKKIFNFLTTICHDIADKHYKCNLISGLLDELEILCQIYFLNEEQMMEDMNYPLAGEHKHQHDLFLATIDRFKIDNNQCHTISTINDFIKIREDFITHMLNETTLLSEFINKRSDGDSAIAAQ